MKNFLIFLLFIIGCSNAHLNGPHATPVVTDTDKCQLAEIHLKELKCIPTDQPYTKKGKSFTQFCQETQANGIFINPKCLSDLIIF